MKETLEALANVATILGAAGLGIAVFQIWLETRRRKEDRAAELVTLFQTTVLTGPMCMRNINISFALSETDAKNLCDGVPFEIPTSANPHGLFTELSKSETGLPWVDENACRTFRGDCVQLLNFMESVVFLHQQNVASRHVIEDSFSEMFATYISTSASFRSAFGSDSWRGLTNIETELKQWETRALARHPRVKTKFEANPPAPTPS